MYLLLAAVLVLRLVVVVAHMRSLIQLAAIHRSRRAVAVAVAVYLLEANMIASPQVVAVRAVWAPLPVALVEVPVQGWKSRAAAAGALILCTRTLPEAVVVPVVV